MAIAGTLFLSLDCAEPLPLAEFWGAMLGGEVAVVSDATVCVRTSWVWLAAMRVQDYQPPTWPASTVPKQMHLDLGVDDLAAALTEALAVGAVPADFQPAPDKRRILLDPAGHPFCLTTQIPAVAR